MSVGTVVLAFIGSLLNALFLLPVFSVFYGIDLNIIVSLIIKQILLRDTRVLSKQLAREVLDLGKTSFSNTLYPNVYGKRIKSCKAKQQSTRSNLNTDSLDRTKHFNSALSVLTKLNGID